MKRRVAIWV